MMTEKGTMVAIHGVPRSGTSWLGEIFNSSPSVKYSFQPLFSYRFKGLLTPESSVRDIRCFFDSIRSCEDDFIDQVESRKSGLLPVFEKEEHATHVVYKEVRYHHILRNLVAKCPEIKLCLLVRNPFAVINSWLNAPREFRNDLGWKVDEEWRFAKKKNQHLPEEFNGFERWKEATNLFLNLEKEFPKSVIVSHYSRLVSETEPEVQRLFKFCGLQMNQQTIDFVEQTNCEPKGDAYSVFKKCTNDDRWQNELPTRIADAIKKDLVGTALEHFISKTQ